MSEELVGRYVDRGAFISDTDFMAEGVLRIIKLTEQLKNIKVDIQGATSLKTLTTSAQEATVANEKLKKSGNEVLSGIQALNISASTYTKLLAELAPEVNNLSEEQSNMLKIITEQFKAEEQQRQGAKATVGLIQGEIAANEKLQAGRTGLARSNAVMLAQLKDEELGRKRLAAVLAAEDGSSNKAQKTIDLLIFKRSRLNLETEQGMRVNEAYKATIEKLNTFIIANGDAETKRIKNIGNYPQAAQLIVDALQKEQKKLQELQNQYQTFNNQASKTTGTFNSLGESVNKNTTETFGYATELKKLETQIEESTTRISSFKAVIDQPTVTKGGSSNDAEVKSLNITLQELEKNQLGNSEVAVQLRARLKELTDQMFQAGTAAKTIGVLDIEIKKLESDMVGLDQGSQKFKELNAQVNLLKSVSSGLNKTFSGTKTELRALEEAAKRIGTEFGVGSAQFIKFANAVGQRKNEIKDVTDSLKFKSSDTQGLDATLQGIQAITSAYGAYQGIVALTGVENEDLAKSMQKLQAITALVASIQGIVNALQGESALVQGILSVKAAALAAANKLLAGSSVEATAALSAEAVSAEAAGVAVTELAVAESAAAASSGAIAVTATEGAAAMGAEAVAAEGLAVGLTGVAGAEAGVAAGAVTMAGAIAATGIGLIVIALAAAVYKIVTAISEWRAADASLIKANKDLTASLKELMDSTKAYNDLIRITAQSEIDLIERRNASEKARGVTQARSLALDKQLADARAKVARDEVFYNEISEESVANKFQKAKVQSDYLVSLESQKAEYIKKTTKVKDADYEKTIKNYEGLIEKQTQVSQLAVTDYTNDSELLKKKNDTQQEAELVSINIAKLSADEKRRYTLESARLQVESATNINNRIINDEKSTLDERIVALKDNLAQQKKLLNAENAAVQNDPTQSRYTKLISAKKTQDAISNIEKESELTRSKLREDFRIKDLNAYNDMQKKLLELTIQTNDAIADNDAITERERLEAFQKSFQARKAIIEGDLNTQLSSAGISNENIDKVKNFGATSIPEEERGNYRAHLADLEKLLNDYHAQEILLARETSVKKILITKDYYQQEQDAAQKALRELEKLNDGAVEDRTDTYNNRIIDLDKALQRGALTEKQYNEERRKEEAKLQTDLLKLEIDKIEKSLAIALNAETLKKKAKEELAGLKGFVGAETEDQTKTRDDRIKVVTDELKAIEDAEGKKGELYTKLSDLRKQLEDDATNNFLTNRDIEREKLVETLNTISELSNGVISGINGVLNNIAQAQQDRNNKDIEIIEKRKEAELAANEKSQESDEKKNENKIRIEKRAQLQKEQIEEKNKQIQRDQAAREKAFAIFQIILATATNIAKATTIPGKIIAGILGAVQLAVAVSTPLPKFKDGKNLGNKYEGYAVVNDGGKREPILRQDGSVQIYNKPQDTVTWVGANDVIFPSIEHMLKSISMPKVSTPVINIKDPNNNSEVIKNLKAQNSLLREIANKREVDLSTSEGGLVALIRHGSNKIKYLEQQTNWE